MAWGVGYGGFSLPTLDWLNQTGAVGKSEKKSKVEVERTENSCLLSDDDLKSYSIEACKRFYDVWDFDNFWKRANTCDAYLSFLEMLMRRYPYDSEVEKISQKIQEILGQNLVYFEKTDRDKEWCDDFGWWGLMALNAYKHLKSLKNEELAQKYLNLATTSCWEYIIENAYDDTSPDSTPVGHGCRNNDAESPKEGVKNTIINALLLLLSTRLYSVYNQKKQPNRERFLDMAYCQWLWFSKWIDLKGDNEYLKPLIGNDNAALVHERPLDFSTGSNYQDMTHPDGSKEWLWSGDQGILISALIDLLNLKDDLAEYSKYHPEWKFNKNEFETKVKDTLQKLVHGVQLALIGKDDGIFYEPFFPSSYCSAYGVDYFGGLGALVRYMDSSKIKALFEIDFNANISATVKALWSTRTQETNQFNPKFTTDESNLNKYNDQFNALWGSSNQVIDWDMVDSQMKNGICQALGLDFLGAALGTELQVKETY